MGPDGHTRIGWDAAHFHERELVANMNRTRKIAAAGVATAVALVLIAMVAVTPNLHTQTPVSMVPPANGGTGAGNNGAGNGTSNCTASSGNETSENGDHEGSTSTACTSDPVDHDSMGDQMSSEHRSAAADEHIHSGLEADAIALAELGATWAAAAAHGLVSFGAHL